MTFMCAVGLELKQPLVAGGGRQSASSRQCTTDNVIHRQQLKTNDWRQAAGGWWQHIHQQQHAFLGHGLPLATAAGKGVEIYDADHCSVGGDLQTAVCFIWSCMGCVRVRL